MIIMIHKQHDAKGLLEIAYKAESAPVVQWVCGRKLEDWTDPPRNGLMGESLSSVLPEQYVLADLGAAVARCSDVQTVGRGSSYQIDLCALSRALRHPLPDIDNCRSSVIVERDWKWFASLAGRLG